MTSPRPTEKPFESRNGFGTKNRSVLLGLGVALALAASAPAQLKVQQFDGIVELTGTQPAYHVFCFTYATSLLGPWRTFHTVPANVSDTRPVVGIPAASHSMFFGFYTYQIAAMP